MVIFIKSNVYEYVIRHANYFGYSGGEIWI